MPRGGYKSIAIKEEDYDFFKNMWEESPLKYRRKGITSFAGFLTMMLFDSFYKQEHIENLEKLIAELEGKLQDEL